jgi:hypothetical protein
VPDGETPHATTLLVLGFPLGLFESGIVSGMGACFTELFPAGIRASAGGFSYDFGRGIGSLIPAAVGMMSASVGLAKSIGVWAAVSNRSAAIRIMPGRTLRDPLHRPRLFHPL